VNGFAVDRCCTRSGIASPITAPAPTAPMVKMRVRARGKCSTRKCPNERSCGANRPSPPWMMASCSLNRRCRSGTCPSLVHEQLPRSLRGNMPGPLHKYRRSDDRQVTHYIGFIALDSRYPTIAETRTRRNASARRSTSASGNRLSGPAGAASL
jgi:hypothetical protein